jgi:hypothetical protein
MSTDIAILGGRKITLAAGWTKQGLVFVLGGGRVDATATPAPDATLNIVTILGGAEVSVPDGARVTVGGLGLLGGRNVDVRPRADGPEIRVKAFSFLGGVRITNGV